MAITWLDFKEIPLEIFLDKFSLKISDVIFQGQTLYWTYFRNRWSDWCETKKEVHQLDVGEFWRNLLLWTL